jgi:hypothetical protein
MVRAELTALGTAGAAMPAEVSARLSAALAAEPPTQSAGPGRHAAHRTPASLAQARARRRRRQWTAAVGAVAAGVVAFVAFGQPLLRGTVTTPASTKGGAAQAPAQAGDAKSSGRNAEAVPPQAPEAPGLQLTASGLDYRADTIAGFAAGKTPLSSAPNAALSGGGTLNDKTRAIAPADLTRLLEPAARQACLAAVNIAYPGRPIQIDYARFNGAPALVVFQADAAGIGTAISRVVVVGPACGLPGSGADLRYSAPVG